MCVLTGRLAVHVVVVVVVVDVFWPCFESVCVCAGRVVVLRSPLKEVVPPYGLFRGFIVCFICVHLHVRHCC
ncbi:hypothetical protein Micbo1qcDRAFT_156897, partial [Microdochium bolleyi]